MEVIRDESHKPWKHYDEKANELFIESYRELKGVLFNRVEKAKTIAESKAYHIEYNLCNANWIVLSKVEKKRNIVSKFWWGVRDSIECIKGVEH
jgi:hypothetical protein